ncbi:hypothetical protein [Desulfolutivibrio sulfoxidireducens]|uniref:hypothetical protein n=1 Tax=Desulfolutivibrio sulfoxidireducens TaxID=2773299 RepID=UPI00159EB2C4|nr:hypothetical protein [Desulfolutivibrio sulfoxidireducens]QLA17739.1 hypothetical protein GD605_17460 [Desulfolutivibrio sulfoxidireducens]QLA21314.1 hypothetical protein GD604_17070 [Desulfolutivibrio sulfoxidireducens]
MKKALFIAALLFAFRPFPAAALDYEQRLVAIMNDIVKYYDNEARKLEDEIIRLLPIHDRDKKSAENEKLTFLYHTHQKITVSLNNILDILFVYIKLGSYSDTELNGYVLKRIRNNVIFLNNMLYFLSLKNQEIEIKSSSEVQKLYEDYLLRLTTVLYDINRELAAIPRE